MSYSGQDGLNLDHLKWLKGRNEEGKRTLKRVNDSQWVPGMFLGPFIRVGTLEEEDQSAKL